MKNHFFENFLQPLKNRSSILVFLMNMSKFSDEIKDRINSFADMRSGLDFPIASTSGNKKLKKKYFQFPTFKNLLRQFFSSKTLKIWSFGWKTQRSNFPNFVHQRPNHCAGRKRWKCASKRRTDSGIQRGLYDRENPCPRFDLLVSRNRRQSIEVGLELRIPNWSHVQHQSLAQARSFAAERIGLFAQCRSPRLGENFDGRRESRRW